MATETIAHYRLLRKLGAGGMGEVYEAEDLRLGRHAALKFLPDAVSHDAHALERFDREARAASSLDHPNICTIYEIGEHEGRMFIAMQLLEGRDLRQKIGGHPLPVDEILEIGMQIADALEAAHARGIIHRDIKPSNIFVTNRGQAKLLDFGLAKFHLPGTSGTGEITGSTTITQDPVSSPDSVMGTLGYMSPEQALGMELDSRSDLFSLGAVLYEMATGIAPFSGNTSAAIFDSILNRRPTPAMRLNPALPVELNHIINKALEKDREIRSQTAGEIRADLKRLKRDTGSGSVAANGVSPPSGRNRWLWTAIGGALLLGAALALWYFSPLPPLRVTSSPAITHDGLSKFGLATDGSRIYFSENSGGHLALTQISVTGGEPSAIPSNIRNIGIADISPDRSQLLVGAMEGTNRLAAAWALPLPSGSPRRLGDVSFTFGAWSPDMHQIVYTSGSDIFLANADGTDSHRLVSVNGRPFATRFSPDQTRVRFTLQSPDESASSLWEVRADGTGLHPLLPHWHNPSSECCGMWTSDGRYYLFLSRTNNSSDIFAVADRTATFRRVSPAPVQLTAGPLLMDWIVPAVDGKKIFAIALQPRAHLVRYDPGTKLFVPYLSGISATDLAFSRDGQWVAYVTIPEGSLWRSRIDGSERLQLTYPPLTAVLPIWSPDGSRIVFNSYSSDQGWKALSVPAEGGAAEAMLPSGGAGVDFNWSSDGKRLIFSHGPAAKPLDIQVLDTITQQVSKLPESDEMFSPRLSPDGTLLAALSQDSSTLMLYDFASGKWTKWLTEPGNIAFPTWSKDSKYLYFDNFMTDHPTCRRVKLGRTQSEMLFSLAGLNRNSTTASGTWGGLAPDDSRLYIEDRSVQEIYALQLR
jgi:eukaryotic-like serine/threonine-protein kinase